MNRRTSILVVEDDHNLSFLLKTNLEQEGFDVTVAKDGVSGWNSFNDGQFDLCLLDVVLPQQDGFNLAVMIRKKDRSVPIIFLTARTLKEDVYTGFEIGADDYILKPFTIRELLLRMKAILKRSMPAEQEQNNSLYTVGGLKLNYHARKLHIGSEVKNLSTKENELLRIFCESPNTVINRKRLLIEVWGSDEYFVSKSLDVYITRLRKLLSNDPVLSLQNYHSVGFKLVVPQP